MNLISYSLDDGKLANLNDDARSPYCVMDEGTNDPLGMKPEASRSCDNLICFHGPGSPSAYIFDFTLLAVQLLKARFEPQ